LRLASKLGVNSQTKVLDVACGTGEWLLACRQQGAEVAGVDLSEKAISICKNEIPEGHFYAQAAEILPFPDSSFDIVTCLGALEHFIKPLQALQEMRRVANKNARIIILVPNADFLTRRLGLFSGTCQVDAKEVVLTLEEWEEIFNQAGLEIHSRWKDLHILNPEWICRGKWFQIALRMAQALMLPFWPLRWQYQVYHLCYKSS
jgi:ubiquinone/menaquinone biosynthesis C-methylase UbiE